MVFPKNITIICARDLYFLSEFDLNSLRANIVRNEKSWRCIRNLLHKAFRARGDTLADLESEAFK